MPSSLPQELHELQQLMVEQQRRQRELTRLQQVQLQELERETLYPDGEDMQYEVVIMGTVDDSVLNQGAKPTPPSDEVLFLKGPTSTFERATACTHNQTEHSQRTESARGAPCFRYQPQQPPPPLRAFVCFLIRSHPPPPGLRLPHRS